MCGNAPIENPPKRSFLTAAFGSAGAVLLLVVLAGFLSAAGPRESDAAISRSAERARPPGTLLAQTDLPPGSEEEEEEEAWEEEPVDTLSFPQGVTPPPTEAPPPASTTPVPAAAADTTGGAGADSTRGAGADSTRGVAADSTTGAPMLRAGPAVGDTVRYVPGAPATTGAPPKGAPAQPAPEPRKGIFGLHPAAIAFGLVLAHYFIVKSATN